MRRKKRRTTWRAFNLESVVSKTGLTLERVAQRARFRGGLDERRSDTVVFSALDLGTTHAKALVCRVENGRVEVLGQGVEPYSGTMNSASEGNGRSMAAACDCALVQAEDMTERSFGQTVVPDRVVVGIPASTIRLSSHCAHYSRRDASAPVSSDELSRVLRITQRSALHSLAGLRGPIRDPVLLNQCTVQIAIDGHPTNDPIGLRGSELEITVCNILASKSLARSIEKLVDNLKFDPPMIAVQPQAVLMAWRKDLAPDGVGIDVGGRHTTLSLWLSGLLRGILTIPVSGRDLTVQLGRVCRLDEAQAENLKLAFAGGKLDDGQRDWIRDVLRPQYERWTKTFATGLASLAQGLYLPSNIWMWGGGILLEDMFELVQQAIRMEGLSFAGYPTIHSLDSVGSALLHDRTGFSMGVVGTNVHALAVAGATMVQSAPLELHLKEATLAACQAEQMAIWTPVDA